MRPEKEKSLTNGYERQTLCMRSDVSPPAHPHLLSSCFALGQVILKTVGLQVSWVASATLQLGRHGVLDVK